VSVPQLPDRCTIEDMAAAMSSGLPGRVAAMAAPVGHPPAPDLFTPAAR
jgi:hypothetical protein